MSNIEKHHMLHFKNISTIGRRFVWRRVGRMRRAEMEEVQEEAEPETGLHQISSRRGPDPTKPPEEAIVVNVAGAEDELWLELPPRTEVGLP